MAEYDLHGRLKVAVALNVGTISTNTTTNGNIIDTADFEALELVLFTGAYTDGNYAVQVEHGDDSGLSDAAVAASTDLVGTAADLAAANAINRIGYIGKKRYVRLNVVSTAVTTGATVGGVAVQGVPKSMPVADQ